MSKPVFVKPAMSVTHRINEDRAQYLARKVVKLIAKEKWPDILAALFGVMTHTLIRSANTLDEAKANVDRLSTDMKQKLDELWQRRTPLDDAMDKLDELDRQIKATDKLDNGGPERRDAVSSPAGGARRLPARH